MHPSSAVRYIYTHTLIRTLVRIVADSIHKSHFKDAINGVVMNSEGDKQQHQHLKEISVLECHSGSTLSALKRLALFFCSYLHGIGGQLAERSDIFF